MRVLHVSSYFAPAYVYGGPPRSIFELCMALTDTGVDVEVFTTTANGDDELPPSPAQGVSMNGLAVRYFPRSFPRRYFAAAGMRTALFQGVDAFDLVHVHGLWNVPGWLAIDACRKKRVPYVVSPRGMLDDGSFAHHRIRKRICYRLRERDNLDGASFLHATSGSEKESIAKFGLAPPVVVVPNGVAIPPRIADPGFRARWDLPESAPLIVFLGRLHPTKRLDLLIAAFLGVASDFPEALLVIAGREDGFHPGELAGERLGREVRWLGPLGEAEKWALLSETSGLVMCSDSESFGVSVVEALSAGVPVVVTRTCPWEEVTSRGCGLWVPQRRESLADGIRYILSDPGRARQMGRRGRELVAERYRWPAIAGEMVRQYQHALSGAS